MEERRKNIRTELQAELLLKRIDQQTGEKVSIQIGDVSKRGIGFECGEVLEKGAVYECLLTIWTKEVIRSFIEIVRSDRAGGRYQYGGVFIGMNDMDAKRIELYQTIEEYKK